MSFMDSEVLRSEEILIEGNFEKKINLRNYVAHGKFDLSALRRRWITRKLLMKIRVKVFIRI